MSSPSCQMHRVPAASTPCSCQVPFGVSTKSFSPERHLVAVDDRVGALAFHDEAQRRGRMLVRRGDLAGLHHLQARIEPADGGGDILAAGIVEIDDAAAGLLRRDQLERAQDVGAQVGVAPQHRVPRPISAARARSCWRRSTSARGVELLELVVVGVELRGVLDIGAAGHVLAVVLPRLRHRPLPVRPGHGIPPKAL